MGRTQPSGSDLETDAIDRTVLPQGWLLTLQKNHPGTLDQRHNFERQVRFRRFSSVKLGELGTRPGIQNSTGVTPGPDIPKFDRMIKNQK